MDSKLKEFNSGDYVYIPVKTGEEHYSQHIIGLLTKKGELITLRPMVYICNLEYTFLEYGCTYFSPDTIARLATESEISNLMGYSFAGEFKKAEQKIIDTKLKKMEVYG